MTGARTSVGVDGGQTTLRLAVAGTELRAERAGFSYRHSDPYGEQLAAIRECWAEVGRPGPVGRVTLGLTGAPSGSERRAEFAAAVGDLFDADEVWLSGDVVTSHCGALPDGQGVVLAAGTGTACLGVDAGTGALRTVDARGYLFGDDGSAFAVGRAGIAACLRALDGRGQATALADAATARYGPPARLTQRLYASPTVVADTAAFAVEVDTAAARGDQVATEIIAAAADDLHRTVVAAAAVVTGEPVPVAGTGRWFAAPTLHQLLHERLTAEPGLQLVPAAGDALDGACRLAVASAAGAYRPLFHVHERRCHC
ncbi:MAG: hypothetical protein GEV07_26445 [Streptosporangiales bacterium]|nr:hypothetical protein [Streptosporangiales bacterium]